MTHDASTATLAIRPAVDADRPTVEALVARSATPHYVDAAMYALRMAFERSTAESQAIVAETNGSVVGVALFGDIAGTIGTSRLQYLAVTRDACGRGIGTALCTAAMTEIGGRGARAVVAEIPDDPLLASARKVLARCGFVEVARVPDYYVDGIALVILQRQTPGSM